MTFWEEHKNYVELPVCTCGKCECDAAALWEKLQERSRVTKFLMGLIEPYEQTCRHILLLKPIPTIEEAFNFVAQDERQRSLKPATPVDSVAFQNTTPLVHLPDEASYVAAYNTARQVQKPVCTHCGKLGHTVQKCFKLHGYPPGYKTHGAYKNQNQAKNTPVQHQQQSLQTHTANAIANAYSTAGASAYSTGSLPTVTTDGKNMPLQSFTPHQIQQLIAQFNSQVRVPEHQIPFSEVVSKATITDHGIVASTSTSGILPFPSRSLTFENDQLKFHNHCLSTLPSFLPNDAWIIDSGASSHVCSDLHMFTTLTHVSSVSVSFPNGTRVPITHTGTIHISASLILYNVLHVPDFQFNLISVSCLVRSLRCAAHFFSHGYFIQELSRGLMIGKVICIKIFTF